MISVWESVYFVTKIVLEMCFTIYQNALILINLENFTCNKIRKYFVTLNIMKFRLYDLNKFWNIKIFNNNIYLENPYCLFSLIVYLVMHACLYAYSLLYLSCTIDVVKKIMNWILNIPGDNWRENRKHHCLR